MLQRSRTYRNRRWIVAPPSDAAADLARQLRTAPIVAQILLNRGIDQIDACRDFLAPTLRLLHEPELMPGMTAAAQRIARAVRDREKIVIYGDYDVDGITATAILWHAIRRLGGSADYYVPHRIDEGYGLNSGAVESLCAQGYKLIVTVDCGVTAIDPAACARCRGVDLIITDHHAFRRGAESDEPSLPDCFSVVHPRLPCETPYPDANLCGAGVAFKLAWAVGKAVTGQPRVSEEFREFLMDSLALAALGTIADVVPLVGENRVLARFGLARIKNSTLTGLKALVESAGLSGGKIESFHVGFMLAPRLNAAGRMGHAQLAVEMLTTANAGRAGEIATYLESQNRDRQQTERKIFDEALDQAKRFRFDTDEHHAIVLASPGWHPGVIGIVASRVVERFHKPVIMIAIDPADTATAAPDGIAHGSGRSISGFNLAAALAACGHTLESHGGHEMAAGLKLRAGRLDEFRESFLSHARQTLASEALVARLSIEGETEISQITPAVAADLKRLGPFGEGNRQPILCLRNVEIAGPPKPVGKDGQHIQLYLRQNGSHLRAIAFRAAELAEQLKPGMMVDLAIEPTINEWEGRQYVEAEVRDVVVCG
jgi:single-stranded-DNA-specific exonuclease